MLKSYTFSRHQFWKKKIEKYKISERKDLNESRTRIYLKLQLYKLELDHLGKYLHVNCT